jgi:putative component of toxin-antitoxin plasmid stabilization module
MKIVEYLATDGSSPFQEWFDDLDSRAAAKVTTALIRMGMGNTSNVESVGENATDKGL